MKKIILSVIFLAVFTITGCDDKTIVDDGGEIEQTPVFVEEEPTPFPLFIGDILIEDSPEKVVSLSPSLTEIVFELGYGERLVGRGSFCDFPSRVVSLPEAGSGANPDIDRIIALSPDLLLTTTPILARDVFRMEQAGITTLIIPASGDLNSLSDTYRALGLVFEGMFTGAEAGDEAFSVIAKACNNTAVVNIGRFVYITNDLKAATGDTLEHAVFSCFGENIARIFDNYEFDFSVLVDNQPDVILLSDRYTAEDLRASENFSELNAVVSGRIIPVDNSFFERPSARLVDVINEMLEDYRNLVII
ncbi:MAG: helical backbone metal receptor [Oscillospiraceae bacterium]|nr:helical backbone metal receptor [Oscillospiraceae bacterium]